MCSQGCDNEEKGRAKRVVFDFIQESDDLKGEPFDEEKVFFICVIPGNISTPRMRGICDCTSHTPWNFQFSSIKNLIVFPNPSPPQNF